MQTLRSRRENARQANDWHWGRVGITILVLMAVFSPLMQVASAQPPTPVASPPRPVNQIVVTGTCLNNSAAQTNLSLTMHNIFLVMAGVGGGIVVIALAYWGITHSATSVFEESSAEQKMKRKKQLFDILVGGLVILMAATIWGVIAGTVVGASC